MTACKSIIIFASGTGSNAEAIIRYFNNNSSINIEARDHQSFIMADIPDRGASIRIPILTVENGWKGWLEDRRPASNGDPYKIAARIIQTVKSTEV